MRWGAIAEKVGKIAPLAGTLLGGPAGGAIGGMIASALGVENSPSAVEAAIASDPNAALKLKELEVQHKADMEQLAIEQYRAEAEDRADARAMNKDNKTPAVLCFALSLMVAGGACLLFFTDIPEANREIAYLLFGTLLAKWGDTIAYWVGSSRGSAQKTAMMGR